jgi:hypothetical protein
VAGRANDGTGVLADSANGIALEVNGKAKFSRSGRATVAGTALKPKASVTVTGVALAANSMVMVTPQKNVAGAWVRAAVPNVVKSQFTVYLNQAVSVGFPVAWMVIEKP